jgi:DNA-binding MarR family transcriptional regulator
MPSSHGRAVSAPRPQAAEGSFRQLLRTLGLLERVMQPYFARFGITGAQWGVLCNLHRAEREGQPALRLTDLSERLLIRPPSVSSVVDRLERARLVTRGDSATDLRSKPVALTERGRHLVERILSVHGAQIESLMGALTAAEQAELQGMLRRLEEHMAVLLADGGLLNDA